MTLRPQNEESTLWVSTARGAMFGASPDSPADLMLEHPMHRNTAHITDDLVQAWNSSARRRIAGLQARHAVMVHPLFPDTVRGREAIIQAESPLFAAFSEIEWKVANAVASDDQVAVEWEVAATHTGPMPTAAGPLEPTGRRIRIKGSSHFRFNAEGAIASEHRYLDGAGMFAQLTG